MLIGSGYKASFVGNKKIKGSHLLLMAPRNLGLLWVYVRILVRVAGIPLDLRIRKTNSVAVLLYHTGKKVHALIKIHRLFFSHNSTLSFYFNMAFAC